MASMTTSSQEPAEKEPATPPAVQTMQAKVKKANRSKAKAASGARRVQVLMVQSRRCVSVHINIRDAFSFTMTRRRG